MTTIRAFPRIFTPSETAPPSYPTPPTGAERQRGINVADAQKLIGVGTVLPVELIDEANRVSPGCRLKAKVTVPPKVEGDENPKSLARLPPLGMLNDLRPADARVLGHQASTSP